MTDSVLLFLALTSHPFPVEARQVGLVEGMEVSGFTIGAGVGPPVGADVGAGVGEAVGIGVGE